MSKLSLKIRKNNLQGDMAYEYRPLQNMKTKEKVVEGGKEIEKDVVGDFDTKEISYDVLHPVDIECQPSYDNSVNTILNDDKNPPRMVNTAFSLLEDNTYKRVIRNQRKQTNYYSENDISTETRLQRISNTFCKIDFGSISEGGSCKGGNYTFYIRYADEDGNLTPFVAESGQFVVFNGNTNDITSIYGTIESAATDKMINLKISDLDQSFSKLKLYYNREFSDANGVQKSEFKAIERLYTIKDSDLEISLSGLEKLEDTTEQELNIKYNIYDRVKTQAQVQNMLFFGNVDSVTPDFVELQNLAYYIQVSTVADHTISTVSGDYERGIEPEYYSPENIYRYTGYLPGEWYRLGVVFVLENDQCTDVFNLLGCKFSDLYEVNTSDVYLGNSNIDQQEIFKTDTDSGDVNKRYNTKGIFRTPDINLYQNGDVCPIAFEFSVQQPIVAKLKELGVKGLFFVRQKRIPIFLAQGCSIMVSPNSHTPLIPYRENNDLYYYTQGPVNDNKKLAVNHISMKSDVLRGWQKAQGIVCQEAFLNKNLQSLFNGTEFKLRKAGEYSIINVLKSNTATGKKDWEVLQRNMNAEVSYYDEPKEPESFRVVFVPAECPSMIVDEYWFSSKAGSAEDLKSIKSLTWNEKSTNKEMNSSILRGNFGSYLGLLTSNGVDPMGVYNIYTSEYDDDDDFNEKIITVRSQTQDSYTAISNRIGLDELISGNKDDGYESTPLVAYRGDCFTGLVSSKMEYNFLDSAMPLNTKILDNEEQWKNNDYLDTWKSEDHDPSSWNAVPLGFVFTYRYLSAMNLSIRSINEQYSDERALFGGYRSFYPHNKFTYSTNWKLPESDILNFGLSNNRNKIHFFEHPNVPYIKDMFDTRVAFSNIQVDNAFKNSYRIFQGLSFQDLERTYGALTKLLPLGANLLGVFEHGIGIIPVNEKALLQTTTGQNIHMYGAGVLQSQISVISQDYGSTWEDSIIVTPDGIYGVDTFAKKIWKYNTRGFQLISDQIINSFLNDNLDLSESEKTPIVAYRNVKSHYNNYKGDVMFTFYNGTKTWNLCFNERLNKWTTRYS